MARGLAGGFRQRYLGIRDQLIGIGLLRADGVAARAGGKVVKNVAGYDLMRLFCGSWGSLGLITELTLRTLPLPPQRRGLWIQGDLADLERLSRWLLRSSLTPERVDWWSGPLAAHGRPGGSTAAAAQPGQRQPPDPGGTDRCLSEQALQAGPLHCQPLDGDGSRPCRRSARARPPRRTGLAAAAGGSLTARPSSSWLPPACGSCPWCWAPAADSAWPGPHQRACLPAYRVEELRRLCKELGGYLTVLLQPPAPAWPPGKTPPPAP